MKSKGLQVEFSTLIFVIRGSKVMLDFHLASLYGVETRQLKQAVRRNQSRFPDDFMFLLTENEVVDMVSQNVIPSKSYFGGALPMAFTEQGVAMLSTVLRSAKAIQINIEIMRAFVRYRAILRETDELRADLRKLDRKLNESFRYLVEKIDALHQKEASRAPIGFKTPSPKD